MRTRIALTAVCFQVLLTLAAVAGEPRPPDIDSLAGEWQLCELIDQMPAISNFHGALAAGRNVLSIVNLTQPPLSQGGEAVELSVDGEPVRAERSRWYPHQIVREATADPLRVQTAVRMVSESPGLLFVAAFTNTDTARARATVGVRLGDTRIRHYPGRWEWAPPRPNRPEDGADFSARVDEAHGAVLMEDRASAARAVFAFGTPPDRLTPDEAAWNLDLAPGETREVALVLSVGVELEPTAARALAWAEDFAAHFGQAKAAWQDRYASAFLPENGHFSGHLPVLETEDEAIARLYYTGIAGFLSLERANLHPDFPRVFVTCAPAYAPTLTYFWDTISYSTVWCLLDPEQVRAQLKQFLSADIHGCYAVDWLTLEGAGPWYSANDYTVFHLLWTWLRVTGDWEFLDESVAGRPVAEHLHGLATHWRGLRRDGSPLADYGGRDNLLETVPTYVHEVASFNAANVWMMRRMAEIHARRGDATRAAELNTEAGALAQAVLGLYAPGKGWWHCRLPGGELQEVRSVVDFLTVAACMPEDLTALQREEMTAFVLRELWTGNWLRALSLDDPSALAARATEAGRASLSGPWPGDSLRADHGCTGTYGAWPALTIESFARFGRQREAEDMLRAVATLLDEGPIGQSHYVATELRHARKAANGGQDFFEGCGAACAEVIIRWLYGYDPAPERTLAEVVKAPPRTHRGRLVNLRHEGGLVTIVSGADGVRVAD